MAKKNEINFKGRDDFKGTYHALGSSRTFPIGLNFLYC